MEGSSVVCGVWSVSAYLALLHAEQLSCHRPWQQLSLVVCNVVGLSGGGPDESSLPEGWCPAQCSSAGCKQQGRRREWGRGASLCMSIIHLFYLSAARKMVHEHDVT